MAYSTIRGRKPAERASKISHTEIINNSAVRELLSQCAVPKPADKAVVQELTQDVAALDDPRIKHVVAIDGGYRETAVREDFPSAAITFFTFGPLLFKLEDLRELDTQPFLAPEDMARLKNIERYTLALPTRNISRSGNSLRLSVRETLQEFFERANADDPPLTRALRWVLFRGWTDPSAHIWEIPECPNYGCTARPIVFKHDTPDQTTCNECGGPLFLVDTLRLHERIDEEQGAGGISGYVMTTLEQLVLVHVVKALFETKPLLLSEILFIKDGPLAFFGQTAPLSKPMRELATFLGHQPDTHKEPGHFVSLLNVVGLEKSGAFVEHAVQIADRLAAESVLLLSNDYIYRYVVPGDPASADPYGKNTYWGSKLIYKAADGNVYVATVPTGVFTTTPAYDDFQNLTEILRVLGTLRCSMYDNALVPVALANKLISLSEFPSSRILETFAKDSIGV
jgi:NurA domain